MTPVNGIAEGSLEVGQLGPFLLRPGIGNRVVVEVRAQAGASPSQRTIDHIVNQLAAASHKTVVVDGPDSLSGGARAWTTSMLTALADRDAQVSQGGHQVALRLLFLRGTFEGDTSVLGASVRRDVAAVFEDQIDATAGLLADRDVIEDAIALHEVGHLLGLVDLVIGGAPRGDPDHPGHSRNPGSVMYWAVESDAIAQLLGARVPTEFDADDRAELAAIRNG